MTSDEVAKLLADTAAGFIPNLASEKTEDIGILIIFTNERLKRAAMPLIGGARPTAEVIHWAMTLGTLPIGGEEDTFEKGNAS